MATTLRRVTYARPKLEFLSRAFSQLGFNMRGFMIMLPGAAQSIADSLAPTTVLSARVGGSTLSVRGFGTVLSVKKI
jgi:hypothetical protein